MLPAAEFGSRLSPAGLHPRTLRVKKRATGGPKRRGHAHVGSVVEEGTCRWRRGARATNEADGSADESQISILRRSAPPPLDLRAHISAKANNMGAELLQYFLRAATCHRCGHRPTCTALERGPDGGAARGAPAPAERLPQPQWVANPTTYEQHLLRSPVSRAGAGARTGAEAGAPPSERRGRPAPAPALVRHQRPTTSAPARRQRPAIVRALNAIRI